MENVEINLSMEKIIVDYPRNSLPTKFHKRTGKAKKCKYEEIDLTLYEPSARMLSFYTTIERIQPWIKALHVLYYDNLGNEGSEYLVKWDDEPSVWVDPNNAGNKIIIELHLIESKPNTLQYKLTFFVTTGTIVVQGQRYQMFVEHFQKLKQILDQVITSIKSSGFTEENEQTRVKSVESLISSDENYDTDIDTNEEDLTVVEHSEFLGQDQVIQDKENNDIPTQSRNDPLTDSNNNLDANPIITSHDNKDTNESVESNVYHDKIDTRLEKSLVDAITKLENCQITNSTQILSEVADCKFELKRINKSVDSIKSRDSTCEQEETQSLRNKIKILTEEKQSLMLQLQHERNASLLCKSQYEDALKHEKIMTEEARSRLHKLVEANSNELSFISTKLDEKNKEIDKLSEAYSNMKFTFNKVQDEALSLKAQLSDTLEELSIVKNKLGSASDSATTSTKARDIHVPDKPSVYLIGTSNTKGINEDKLTVAAEVKKYTAYTLDDTRSCIAGFGDPPDVFVLHVLTNDLKVKMPQMCVNELCDIVSTIQKKWAKVKIIVSLTTPRKDSMIHNTNGQIINAMMKQKLSEINVLCVDHSNMAVGGEPISDFLQEDGYHLSVKGIAQLAGNMKKVIHSALGIPLPVRKTDRSRSRHRRGRGYFRGYRGGRGRNTSPV